LILTVSKREIVAAISANFAHISSRLAPPQWRGSSTGHDNHTASCGDHSGGIANPALDGFMLQLWNKPRAIYQHSLRAFKFAGTRLWNAVSIATAPRRSLPNFAQIPQCGGPQ
jgi:hypothetical protein